MTVPSTRRYRHDAGVVHPPAELIARSLDEAIRTCWAAMHAQRGWARGYPPQADTEHAAASGMRATARALVLQWLLAVRRHARQEATR